MPRTTITLKHSLRYTCRLCLAGFLSLAAWTTAVVAANNAPQNFPDPASRPGVPYPEKQDLYNPFIDSLISTFSIRDMAAQTIILRSEAKPTADYIVKMRTMLSKHPFGGVCFFAGRTPDMLTLQQVYKDASRIPLFITIDGEFGPGMRMTDLKKFPRQQLLGAIEPYPLLYLMGKEVGKQCRMLGIQWNYLPVVDVNNNPLNPVINSRSFGEDPAEVAKRGILFLKGMQSEGVYGSAKHFPGHGDTEQDSHLTLPVISDNRHVLDSIHLYPFRRLIESGVESVMVGHLNVPAYDSSGVPSSLSPVIVTDLLRNELGFKGMIVTDGLEMNAVHEAAQISGKRTHKSEKVEVRALAAGCDVLLLPLDPEQTLNDIEEAVENGNLPKERLEEACRRILYYKTRPHFLKDYGKNPSEALMHNLPHFIEDSLNGKQADLLQQALYNSGVTLVDNMGKLIPVSSWDYPEKICLHIGDGSQTEFSRRIASYDKKAGHIYLNRNFDPALIYDTAFIENICRKDLIIVSITNTNYLPARNYGISSQSLSLIERLQKCGKPIILTVFAPPYALQPFYSMPGIHSILCGYQEVDESQRACADLIFGALPARGKLPVSVEKLWPCGYGIRTESDRLLHRIPEEIGLRQTDFFRIDSIVQNGIQARAYPGCQVLVALDGNIIYDKCFGRATYDSNSEAVTPESLYDLASLSKILSTTLAYMRLYEIGAYRLDQKIGDLLPRLNNTDKRHITFRQVLCHQSGLKAYLKYMEDSVYKGKPVFSTEPSSDYPYQVAQDLYIDRDYRKHIRHLIDQSPINPRKPYVYSDLGFYYLNLALERMTDTTLPGFVEDNFYRFLGLEHLCYHPTERFEISQIMPTEIDTVLRHRAIRGFVHDPLVAMLGGEGGSAGLFSNSYDVAVIAQMLLQKGHYGGIQFFDSATVALFTSSAFSPADNRRGGGFDKPPLKAGQPSPTAPSASPSSYGHSGFTGTFCWIDPEYRLVYVFLSNRVYPDASNNKITSMGIRTAVLEEIYRILGTHRP